MNEQSGADEEMNEQEQSNADEKTHAMPSPSLQVPCMPFLQAQQAPLVQAQQAPCWWVTARSAH